MNVWQQPRHNILKFFILLFLGAALYVQTLDDPFHFDDHATIVGNKAVHYLPDWPLTVKEILAFQPSRFVTNVTFALNYYAHRLDVFGYHVVNVFVHLITTYLVWWLGILLLQLQTGMSQENLTRIAGKKKSKKKSEIKMSAGDPWKDLIPFGAAALFLVHPVNTEAVTYISQRSESLAALFYVAAVCLYIRGRLDDQRRLIYFCAAFASGLLATFSKETAVTLPLMIILVEWFFFKSGARAIKPAGVLLVLFVLLVPSAFHFNYQKILFTPYLSQSHVGDVLTLPTYLLTQLNVFVTFLRLMFFPVGLNLDHDYPMAHSLLEPKTLFSFVFLLGLLAAAFRVRRKNPMLAFAVFWFFLTLSSNLVPRAHVFFEHKLYLALAGTLPALFLGLTPFFKNLRALLIAMCIVSMVFWGLAFARNRVWDSDLSLWEDVMRKSPHKARVHLSLGTAHAVGGNHEEAIKFLTESIGMTGDPHRAYVNRGVVYVKMKKDDLALKDFDAAIKANPRYIDAYVNRGEVFARRKDYDAALSDFNKAIELDGNGAPGYKMRGRVFDALHQYGRALGDYKRAIEIEPGDAQALAWRGYIYAIAGNFDKAFADFNAALRLDPNFSDAYVYRGMYFKDRNQTARGLQDFNKAIALKPSSSLAHYQRANLFFSSGDAQAALRDVERAIMLDEDFDLPYALRAVLYAQRKEYALAMDDFDRALELNPESFEVYMNRGSLHLLMDNKLKAVEDLTRAVRLNPSAADAYSKRGGAYGHLGKYELALADFTKAIELNPRQGSDYYNRSVLYSEHGELSKALKDALKARELGFSVSDGYLQQFNK